MAFLHKISNNSSSDDELVAQYKLSGNSETLAFLYQQYMELVYGVCLKYLEDQEVAKDAVMNIYVELGPKVQKHEIGNFRSWLYIVAKNHCLMHLRNNKNRKTVSFDEVFMQSPTEMHPADAGWQKEEQLSIMEDCLQTLTQDQKRNVELFYLQNKSYNEITLLTGYEWKKVRSLIQNGRRNLKICMENKVANEMTKN